jgi:hypothetical protein
MRLVALCRVLVIDLLAMRDLEKNQALRELGKGV